MNKSQKIWTVYDKQKKEKKSIETSSKNIHNSLKYNLILAQLFGLLPVQGVVSSNVQDLKFTWLSWRVLFSSCVCMATGFIAVMNIHHIMKYGNNLVKTGRVMFYGSSMAFIAAFINLAKHWPRLMTNWCQVEVSMANYGWTPYLKLKLLAISTTILTIGAFEHIMIEISNVRFAQRCKPVGQSTAEYYFGHAFPGVFPTFQYAWWKGFLIQVVNSIDTFSWTFGDVMIMIMSRALSLRFRQVTIKVQKFSAGKVIAPLLKLSNEGTDICDFVRGIFYYGSG